MKDYKKHIVVIVLLIVFAIVTNVFKPVEQKEIIFGDAGWDSVQLHNAIAGLIAEEVYGYSWREIPGSTAILHEGLLYNEVDLHMEMWTDNIASYESDLKDKRFTEVTTNFDDNKQGFYVPRYVIEGDEERGIEPMAPDLKYVWDLKNYKDVFQDEEQSSVGRIYGSIPGWDADVILHNKYEYHGLDENFRYFRPGSEAALATAFTSAYEKGEAIVGYYWEPTWLLGLYDFVLLEDEPYDEATYRDGETAMPSVKVTIGASNKFVEENPDIMEFLENYHTSSELISSALGHMQETGADVNETAIWFLKEYDYLLDEWLNEENAKIMRDYLNI